MFKFCLVSNYSNSVLFLVSVFVLLLHKQGKLKITLKKNKKKELAIDYILSCSLGFSNTRPRAELYSFSVEVNKNVQNTVKYY